MNEYMLQFVKKAMKHSGLDKELLNELEFHSFCQLLVHFILEDMEVEYGQ